MRLMAAGVLSGIALLGSVCWATPITVTYDASGNALPSSAGLIRFDADHLASSFPLSPYYQTGYNAPQSASGGVYSTGPTVTGKYTFWYLDTLTLNAAAGFEIKAEVRLLSQSTSNESDRGGFALGLTDSNNQYQELYFHTDEIFLNKTGRVRDVAYALDTTQWHDYRISVSGSAVSVAVDGVTRLTGSTFATSGAPTLANWAVFGDITSSAEGSYELREYSVTVVPEPGTALLAVLAAGALVRRRRGA